MSSVCAKHGVDQFIPDGEECPYCEPAAGIKMVAHPQMASGAAAGHAMSEEAFRRVGGGVVGTPAVTADSILESIARMVSHDPYVTPESHDDRLRGKSATSIHIDEVGDAEQMRLMRDWCARWSAPLEVGDGDE